MAVHVCRYSSIQQSGVACEHEWIEEFVDARVLPQFDRIFLGSNRILRSSLEHQRRHCWRPISTAPYNQDLELGIRGGKGSRRGSSSFSVPSSELRRVAQQGLGRSGADKSDRMAYLAEERVTTSSCVEVADGASSLSFRLRSGSTPHAERWGRTAQRCVIELEPPVATASAPIAARRRPKRSR